METPKDRSKSTLPQVAVNFAITWDGKVSTRNFTPANFTSKRDKHRLLEIRATGDAILVGKNTVANDNMSMGLPDEKLRAQRLRRKQAAWPLRVVISNSGHIDTSWKIFQQDFSPVIIYSTTQMPESTQTALAGKALVHVHLHDKPAVDLKKMLRHLRSHYKVKRLVCEGGPSLFRALLAANLVQEINLTLSPHIFGGTKAPTLTGPPRDFLLRAISSKLVKSEIIGNECYLRYRVITPAAGS
ncbi:MAG: RibD family protein [Chthoniobacteraceae bacterium]